MDIRERMKQGFLCYDGGMGTALIRRGLQSGERSERWNIDHPEEVTAVHLEFLRAGADIILANTFGANRFHYTQEELEQVIRAGIRCAKEAVAQSGKEAWVALDIGSTGHLLPPMGMLPFEEAVEIFGEIVRIGADAGADLVQIETMNDVYELKAAVLAARENCGLPVFATAVFDETAHMLTGTSPESAVALLEGLGCSAVGLNCGVGPEAAEKALRIMSEYASLPLIAKPNAGLPRVENGETYFDVTPEAFAAQMRKIMEIPGVQLVGGCCGTTAEHIRQTCEAAGEQRMLPAADKPVALISSYQSCVNLGDSGLQISTAIDPAKDSELLEDLQDGAIDTVLDLADEALDDEADVLSIRLAAEGVDEAACMKEAVMELQNINTMPFAIDSTDPAAVEAGIRIYNGKALVNAGEASGETLERICRIAARYGAVVNSQRTDREAVRTAARDSGLKEKDLVFGLYPA
ncbi:MAG: homocysteine S-methyltransferase family protein [Eubacterium sp.]|jgi:5-methyltetrahydrofolate--homocysteine methyltransferase